MSLLKELPAGWAWATLRELADLKGGITKGQRRSNGAKVRSVPYLRVANVQRAFLDLSEVKTIEAEEGEIADLLLRPGDILFNEGGDRDKLGRGWIWRGELPECIHQNHVFRARLRSSDLQPKLVSWYANFVGAAYFSDEGKQTTNLASINLTKLGGFPVPVPPVEEQGRIVAEVEKQLTRLDVGVESLKRVQAQLKRYRASVLKAACEGRLVPTEAELARREKRGYEPADRVLARNKIGTAVQGTESVPLPEGWCWATIARTIEIIDYRGRTPPYADAGIPHLRSSNVRDGRVVWENLRYVTQATYDQYMTRGIPCVGDLLFSTEAPLGELAPVPAAPFSLAQRLMVLRPDKRVWNAAFLMYQMMSPSFRARLTQQGTGSTVTGVSSRNFQPLPLAVPPLAEQQRIVSEVEARLSAIAAATSIIDASLRRAGSLRYSILKAAFEGSLVPQDPRDEPASKLLERISTALESKPVPKQSRAKQITAAPKMKATR